MQHSMNIRARFDDGSKRWARRLLALAALLAAVGCVTERSTRPIEAIRVLSSYGNPEVNVLCNVRPIHPVGVISGELDYPSLEDAKSKVTELSKKAWFINATDRAMEKMGNPIFGNIILLGALAGTGLLPLDRDDFEAIIQADMSRDKVEINLEAYDMGAAMVKN